MGKAKKNLAEDSKMNEVAQVIWASKIINREEDRTYWSYYGAPARSLWESTYREPSIQYRAYP